MRFRACIAAAATVALLALLGPGVAQANHSFSVSKTEAAAGEEVEFQISSTLAGDSYILKVDDEEVASGVDSTGNGISDKFKMPDFGNSNQSVSVEVRITPLGGEPDHFGSQPMKYLTAFSGATGGQPTPQPAPVPIVPLAEAVADPPQTSTTPQRPSKPTTPKEDPGNNTGSSPTSGSDTSTDTTSSTPSSTSTGSGSSGTTRHRSSNVLANRGPDVPGPTGPNAPVATSIASALSPLSGIAKPGTTGFPVLLILLIVLLVAAALTAAGPRLWQRWEPALPWGPDVDDDMRLGALGRASASGAELQQTIASRRATRSAGRAG